MVIPQKFKSNQGHVFFSQVLGGGTPLVFVHGNSQSSQTFDKTLSHSSLSEYRLLALDLPGHGKSERLSHSSTRYSLQLFAKVLAEFVQAQNADEGVLIGHSLGAHICFEALPLLPQIKGVLSLNAAPISRAADLGQLFHPSLSAPLLFKKDLTDGDIRQLQMDSFSQSARVPAHYATDLLQTDPRVRTDLFASVGEGLFCDELAAVNASQAQILLATGLKDALINVEFLKSRPIQRRFEDQVFLFRDSAHYPHVEESERFVELLKRFAQSF